MRWNPKPGDEVEVADTRQRRKIERLYSDIEGGVRLDREVNGFKSWNVDELRPIRVIFTP